MSAPLDRTTTKTETVYLDHCHQTSVWRDRKCFSDYQMSQMCHTICQGPDLICFRNLGSLGGCTLGSTNVEGGLHSPFQVKTKLDKIKIINCYVHPHRNLYWLEALHQLMDKDAVKPVQNLWASTFLGSKAHNRWRPILDLSKPNLHHPPTRGVGYLNRFQRHLLPYTNTGTVQEISEISCAGSDIPVQSTAFRSVHSTHGVHCSSKGVETDGHTQGYKNPPVPS